MYKEDSDLNNQQWLILQKTQPNQSYVFDIYVWRGFGIE